MNKHRILEQARGGSANIHFADMVRLIEAFGFRLARVKGSHHIFKHGTVRELVNFQNVDGKAKRYQISQFLELVERYKLTLPNQ